MKTQGEIEAEICEGVSRFEQEYMGRGPKAIHAHLIGDLLVVRLEGVLTAAEQQLAKSLLAEKGRDLLKDAARLTSHDFSYGGYPVFVATGKARPPRQLRASPARARPPS